jgi:hypothetical protein
MCVMPDSNATPAITESRQSDFPHSLQDYWNTRKRLLYMEKARFCAKIVSHPGEGRRATGF